MIIPSYANKYLSTNGLYWVILKVPFSSKKFLCPSFSVVYLSLFESSSKCIEARLVNAGPRVRLSYALQDLDLRGMLGEDPDVRQPCSQGLQGMSYQEVIFAFFSVGIHI